MEEEVRSSFLEYSMSVIVSRALPDVRDGLKPGQRRILYAMYEDHLTSSNPFRKSATTVGNVLGRYHPHGDAAVYTTMVRMAQPFSMRHILVEGHGNFGSVDGDPPAAYRYTEARLAKISDEMMRDIDKNVVNWNRNFDNRLNEPEVLPSRFPNILVNGSIGIAVGMATNIPTHNLGEVIDGTVYMIDHPDCTVEELMQFIQGPDFPTAATIYGKAGIYEAYKTGHGRINVRAKAEVDEENHRIIITEIPYMVVKSNLVKAMADQVKEKRIDGVTDFRDESGRGGMRIVIEHRKDVPGQIILNHFYKYTQLQDTCAVNMLALVNGEPKVLPLKNILRHYIDFQTSVVTRKIQFNLDKALAEAHIQEGYRIAIDHLDEVIAIIRASRDPQEAKENLMKRFTAAEVNDYLDRVEGEAGRVLRGGEGLSEAQASAIVQMQLGRLTGMEREKVDARILELEESVRQMKEILGDDAKIREQLKEDLLEIKRKYATPRLTEIVEASDEIVLEDLIEKHICVITMSESGYIKRLPAETYNSQRRGGKGIIGMATKEDDVISRMSVAHSHDHLLIFTSLGRVYMRRVFEIPESGRTAKGNHVRNVIHELENDENVTALLALGDFPDNQYLLTVTKKGVVKRSPLSEYSNRRKGGKIALTLDEGDELLFVAVTDGTKDLLIATRNGLGARFSENRISVIGRTGRGVAGIRLRSGDEVCGAALVENSPEWNNENLLIAVTQNGYGKRMRASDFEAKGRNIQGVICYGVNSKTGPLVSMTVARENDDLMIITREGIVIRTAVSDVPVYGRPASGVILMKPSEGDYVRSFGLVSAEEVAGDEEEYLGEGDDLPDGEEDSGPIGEEDEEL
ncbi:MAG: DNA gyrase subunit A [Clostridia bacterium]|nr:DNA gyrase subunit A [Clostridia bacterium]